MKAKVKIYVPGKEIADEVITDDWTNIQVKEGALNIGVCNYWKSGDIVVVSYPLDYIKKYEIIALEDSPEVDS